MSIAFMETLAKHPKTGEASRVVVFTRETTGKDGKLYDVVIFPDGTELRRVNSRDVESFPNLPSTRQLEAKADRLKRTAMELLATPDDATHRSAWWALRDATRTD